MKKKVEKTNFNWHECQCLNPSRKENYGLCQTCGKMLLDSHIDTSVIADYIEKIMEKSDEYIHKDLLPDLEWLSDCVFDILISKKTHKLLNITNFEADIENNCLNYRKVSDNIAKAVIKCINSARKERREEYRC